MKDVGLNLNADESTCVFMSCEANVEQIYKAKIANQSIETVENFKCSGVKLWNKNLLWEGIKNI